MFQLLFGLAFGLLIGLVLGMHIEYTRWLEIHHRSMKQVKGLKNGAS